MAVIDDAPADMRRTGEDQQGQWGTALLAAKQRVGSDMQLRSNHWRREIAVMVFAASASIMSISQAATAQAEASLVGTWSFDGRRACKSGLAWVFSPDGSYSEVMLPDRTPRGTGGWREQGGSIFYSLAVPAPRTQRQPRLERRMTIIERSRDRIVAVTQRRVRHVMYRCR